jgi:hypothetical protein
VVGSLANVCFSSTTGALVVLLRVKYCSRILQANRVECRVWTVKANCECKHFTCNYKVRVELLQGDSD